MSERRVAVWIDHDHADIVESADGRKPVTHTIKSFVEPRHRSTGQAGVPPPSRLGGNTEDHDRNRRALQLERFFDRVINAIPSESAVLVMGPGMAKSEFLKRVRRNPDLASRIVRVSTAGKLSINQIAAQLRDFPSIVETATPPRQ